MRKNNEVWVEVAGFEGSYLISNHGKVWSNHSNKLRKLVLDKDGYYTVMLHNAGEYKNLKVHRLVADAFIPNINNYPQVNHINMVKTDNYYENLEWCTSKYNLQHSSIHENKMKKIGRFTLCGELLEVYNSINEATRDGYIQSCISRVCNGVREQHKGFDWRFLDV